MDEGLAQVPVPVAELGAQSDPPVVSQEQTATTDVEAGAIVKVKRKRKTTQNDHSHGSFFLRIGAIGKLFHTPSFITIKIVLVIAFGLGTMIYNGLEFGAFFEVPFTSPCYMILRGVNPVLQMVFTFMQMYFIFMNSRVSFGRYYQVEAVRFASQLNIHRFKVIARFGLMHVVATNICVWIRTLVLEYLKEITSYHKRLNNTVQAGNLFAGRLLCFVI